MQNHEVLSEAKLAADRIGRTSVHPTTIANPLRRHFMSWKIPASTDLAFRLREAVRK